MTEVLTEAKMYEKLTELIEQAGSQNKLAKLLGVSSMYLSDVMTRQRAIGEKIPEMLGYDRVYVYRKKKV